MGASTGSLGNSATAAVATKTNQFDLELDGTAAVTHTKATLLASQPAGSKLHSIEIEVATDDAANFVTYQTATMPNPLTIKAGGQENKGGLTNDNVLEEMDDITVIFPLLATGRIRCVAITQGGQAN